MKKQILLIALLFGIAGYTQETTTSENFNLINMDSTFTNGYSSFVFGSQFKIKSQEELDAEFLELQKEWTLNLMDKYFEFKEEIIVGYEFRKGTDRAYLSKEFYFCDQIKYAPHYYSEQCIWGLPNPVTIEEYSHLFKANGQYEVGFKFDKIVPIIKQKEKTFAGYYEWLKHTNN